MNNKNLSALFTLIFVNLLTAASTWTDQQQHDNLVYLLRQSPSQVMRYNMETEAWLDPIPLAEIPKAFLIDDSHIYISYGRKIERISPDGTGMVHVANFTEDVIQILDDGDLLFANQTSGSYARLSILRKSSFALIDAYENYVDGVAGADIAPSINRIFGRSIGYSPSDLNYLAYTDEGMATGGGETPYHGDYPGANRVWVFPDEQKVVDNSGTVYRTADLVYNNSFGMPLDDLAFLGGDVPIALVGDKLYSFSNTLLETGQYQLDQAGKNLWLFNQKIFVFKEDESITGVGVEIVPTDAFTINQPGEPIDPSGLAYEVAEALTLNGVVYLLNEQFSSLFRWDLQEQAYLETIPLPEAMTEMAFSSTLGRLFLYSVSNRVYRIDMDDPSFEVSHHLTTPQKVNKLVPMGTDLLTTANGSWDSTWVYNQNGVNLVSNIYCCYRMYDFFHEPNQWLFFEGQIRTYLGDGAFGGTIEGNYSQDNFGRVLELSPDGQLIATSEGGILNATSTGMLDSLSNDIVNAKWSSSKVLYTIKTPLNTGSSYQPVYEALTRVQKWGLYYSLDQELTLGGQYVDMLITDDDNLVVITNVKDIPNIHLLTGELDLIPPSSLEAPLIDISNFSATAAKLVWTDAFGEEVYVIERKLSSDATWTEIGQAPMNAESFTDINLVPGFMYQFRVKAVNDLVESAWSNVFELDLTTTVDTRVDPRTINFLPDDVFVSTDDKVYFLSVGHLSIFVWDRATMDWGVTIPLNESPRYMTYSPDNQAIYTMHSDGLLYAISLAATNPIEIQFADVSAYGSMHGIIAAGPYVVVSVANSNWDDHISFNMVGEVVSKVSSRYEIAGGTWNNVAGSIYHFRDGTSPNDLIRTPVAADGTIGNDQDSPYHSSAGITYPIRVQPDGQIVILGSGRIYSATTLEQAGSLPFQIKDAVWIGATLVTAQDYNLYTHNPLTFAETLVFQSSLKIVRILPLSDGNLFLLMESASNGISFEILNQDFEIARPDILSAPGYVAAGVSDSSTISISWNDVMGEAGYRVQRRLQSATDWTTLADTGPSVTVFPDATASSGGAYAYRVIAFNGGLSSEPSPEALVDFSAPPAPSGFTGAALSGFQIALVWDQLVNVTGLSLEQSSSVDGQSFSSWSMLTELPPSARQFTTTGLYPDRYYKYRLTAANGVGSASSETIVQTLPEPPEKPHIYNLSYGVRDVSFRIQGNYQEEFVIQRTAGAASSNSLWAEVGRMTGTGQSTLYRASDLTASTTYTYRVYGVNNLGQSDYSDPVTFTTRALTAPPTVSNFDARTLSSSSIRLTWFDNIIADSYLLERRSDNSDWLTIATLAGGTRAFLDESVMMNVSYDYRISASNSVGQSGYSTRIGITAYDISILIEDDFDPLLDDIDWEWISGGEVRGDLPGLFEVNALYFAGSTSRALQTRFFPVSQGGRLNFKLRIGNDSEGWGRPDSYDELVIQYSTDGEKWYQLTSIGFHFPYPTWIPVSVALPEFLTTESISIRIWQLQTPGKDLAVWAIDNFEVSGKTPEVPELPPFLFTSAHSSRSVALYWITVEGASSYVIERKEFSGFTQIAEVLPDRNYYIDYGLAAETSYIYRVKSRNPAGDSDYSGESQSTTYSQYSDWINRSFGSRNPSDASDPIAVDSFGFANLLRFAFNLEAGTSPDLLDSDFPRLGGLPRLFIDPVTGRPCLQFIRRKSSSNPGIHYQVVESADASNWVAGMGIEAEVDSLDNQWEVVTWARLPESSPVSVFLRVVIEPEN